MGQRIERARALRQGTPRAERKLWSIVRNRRLDGWKFRRQAPIDRYFGDFVCIEAKLVVELDGGQHAAQVVYDAERTAALERCGYKVLRFWNVSVLQETQSVIDAILRELRR